MATSTSRLRAGLTSALFLVLLAAPLLMQTFGGNDGPTSDLERRTLASAPSTRAAFEDWRHFSARLDDWMNDHVGFRKSLILLYLGLRRSLDIEDRTNGVRGTDGWLFGAEDGALSMHRGLDPFTPGEAKAWIRAVSELQRRAEARGARFAVLIAPNKHTVYPEHLSHQPRRLGGLSRLETLEALAPANGIRFVSPRRRLLEAKQRRQMYYKTDTHWTSAGAFVAYRQLMESLEDAGMALRTVAEGQLESREVEHEGDLYGLLGIEHGEPETVELRSVRRPRAVAEVTNLTALDWEDFPAKSWRMEGPEEPSLLVIGDSYFYVMAPFLRESFGRVTFVHHRLGHPPVAALRTGDYDVVLLLMVERFLTYPLEVPREARRLPADGGEHDARFRPSSQAGPTALASFEPDASRLETRLARPWSIRYTRSAARVRAGWWDTARTVVFPRRPSMASSTAASLTGSRPVVASSRIRSRGRCTSARAMAIRCR